MIVHLRKKQAGPLSWEHRAQRLGIRPLTWMGGGTHTPEPPWAQDPQLKCGEETRSLLDFLSALKSSNSRHLAIQDTLLGVDSYNVNTT